MVLLAVVACSSAPPAPAPDVIPDAAVIEGMVDIATLIPDAVIDLRYATDRNLTGAPIYPVARCLLATAVADRLAKAASLLRDQHLRLVLWDCYRPFSMQQILWDRVRDPRYAAEPVRADDGTPLRGSVHSRAAAVDVSLADADGTILAMPTDHDDFSSRAHRSHRAKDPDVRARMKALDDAMTDAGFTGLPTEWWHYDAPEGSRLPLRDDALR